LTLPTKSAYYDTNVIELNEKPLANETKKLMIKAGWTVCQVKRISPRDEGGTYPRFRDQFTKLVLWKIAQYKAHVYFDSDTFIVGNIDDLLASHRKLDNEKYRLGVTRDIRASVWQETFNMGVFVVKPSLDEFNRLMALKANRNFKFETAMSEQGFLNVVYKDKHDKWSLIQTCKHKFTHKKPNNGNFSLLRARKKQTFNERVPRLAKKHAEQRRRGATSNIYR
jgi:hypothetical protein